ncbi:MAG: lysostaphin resistance A-like protein [Pyrinomonadaceae bacterium]
MPNSTSRDEYYADLPLPVDGSSAAPLGPNNPPWNAAAGLGVWLLSVLLIIVMPNLFVIPYAVSRQISLNDSARLVDFLQSDATAVLLGLLAILPAHVLTLLAAWAVATKLNRYSFRQTLGWEMGPVKLWHLAAILIGFFLFALALNQISPEQDNSLLKILRSSRHAVLLTAFLATFTAPFVEEVVYRGVLYSGFQRLTGAPLAIIVITALFSLVHVPQYYPSWTTIVLLTLLSLILTLVRAWSGNLLPCVVLHFLFNGIQSLGLVFGPDLNVPDAPPDAVGFVFQLLK